MWCNEGCSTLIHVCIISCLSAFNLPSLAYIIMTNTVSSNTNNNKNWFGNILSMSHMIVIKYYSKGTFSLRVNASQRTLTLTRVESDTLFSMWVFLPGMSGRQRVQNRTCLDLWCALTLSNQASTSTYCKTLPMIYYLSPVGVCWAKCSPMAGVFVKHCRRYPKLLPKPVTV